MKTSELEKTQPIRLTANWIRSGNTIRYSAHFYSVTSDKVSYWNGQSLNFTFLWNMTIINVMSCLFRAYLLPLHVPIRVTYSRLRKQIHNKRNTTNVRINKMKLTSLINSSLLVIKVFNCWFPGWGLSNKLSNLQHAVWEFYWD